MDFDRGTGRLYVADVGQFAWEEITVPQAGDDLGWVDMEGFHCHADNGCDESAGPNQLNADSIRMPIAEYSSNSGGRCAVTGGYVYRSCEVPGWEGTYLYADYCTGEIFGLEFDGTNVTDHGLVATIPGERVLGAGTNLWGDVYFGTVETTGNGTIIEGSVWRVVPQ